MSDKKKDGLVELLAEIGNSNIEYQYLRDSILNADQRGSECDITFVTQNLSATDLVNGEGKAALVLWVNQDELIAAHKKVTGQ